MGSEYPFGHISPGSELADGVVCRAKPKSLFAQTAGKSVDVGSLDEKIGGKVEKGVGE